MRDLLALALRLGCTAFGGPAVHVAMLRDEVVRRRGWMSDAEFLRLLGATNLIPGPNSTEMVMHVGLLRGGARGLVLAGSAFILPAALIVGAIAALYVQGSDIPAARWLLYGVEPVVIAIVVHAVVNLARSAFPDVASWVIGAAVLVLAWLSPNDTLLIIAAGAIRALPALARRAPVASMAVLPTLALTFLKIGALLYGSGYVLVSFLRDEFVTRLGWLTDKQVLDAVAVGQITPGPVLTTATFIGYLLDGVPGAIVATVAIFLPAFLFVPLLHRALDRLRDSAAATAFLAGVNAASVAVMAAVALQLGRHAIVDVPTAALAAISAVLLLRGVNSSWLVIGGAVAGSLVGLLAS